MLYNRYFHDLFTWLKLYPSHRLDAIAEDHHSCAHRSISSTHTVFECVSSLAYQLDILFTSASVKTILAGVVFTSDVKTLRIDLDPTSQLRTLLTTQSRCSTCWSHPHLGNSLPHLELRLLCRLIPRHLGNLLVHVLLQLLQCRASLGTTAVDFTLFTRSFTCCVRTGGPGGSGSRAPLHPRVACGGR